jgi:hypothetical protein
LRLVAMIYSRLTWCEQIDASEPAIKSDLKVH